MSKRFFKDKIHDGVDLANAKQVAKVMKHSNAIIYRLERREYQLMSTAHRTALLNTFKLLDKV